MIKRLTVICENSVYVPLPLIGEHGLSFLLEGDETTLFDTGQGLGVVHNLKLLRGNISSIDRIIISHGHYDHTGGLMPVLKEHGGKIPVFLHPSAFNDKFAQRTPDMSVKIGMGYVREEYENAGAVFTGLSGYSKISGCIHALCEVKRHEGWVAWDSMLKAEVDGAVRNDPFNDDLSLLIETSSGPVVLLGCAHAGMVEILDQIAEASGCKEFYAVIGGTHLGSAPDDYVKRAMDAMDRYNVQVVAVSHCTGFRVACAFAARFGERFVNASVGRVFEF
jgi:7,8-dihydropterin-6-yl-methyl-4-(beta-D-ribofuranosyl)aminobenzene 5'-phosphate synthase